MPKLNSYRQFNGRHWETGSIHNHLAHRGWKAPHTNQPYSEAFLLGVSGGITFGYFTFIYEGVDPQANILTRSTFSPIDTILSRLGVIQHRLQTSKLEKAVKNLVEALEEGVAPIVWADAWSLPYNQMPDTGMWLNWPIVVFGYDTAVNTAWIADRANVPFCIPTQELDKARARIKKDKFRLLTLDPPHPARLAGAATTGIWDCIKLFTEKPPKGSKNNFGLAAYRFWAKQLTHPKQRLSWAKVFTPGIPMFAGLTFAYTMAFHFGKGTDGTADRELYAQFLEETAVLLNKPALTDAAVQFRKAGKAWQKLAAAMLPNNINPFGEVRKLIDKKHALFIEQGAEAADEILAINGRLDQLRRQMETNFPLTDVETVVFRQQLADTVMGIHDAEETAVAALKDAMLG
ncbi:MAG: hypothetical protein Kow0080_33100 [Candidatus Promineifilaceae bacterium]